MAKTGEEIYQEAQAELKIAERFYSQIYDLRRHLNRYGNAIVPSERKRLRGEIAAIGKKRVPHYRKYKALMKKIVWVSNVGAYRLVIQWEKRK